MRTRLQVLSEEERHQVHERTLGVLAKTGVRVDTAQGRRILRDAGAEVDENTHIVRFQRDLVEESLRLAPKATKCCCRCQWSRSIIRTMIPGRRRF